MTTKIKDAAVVTSKYTLNGQEKARWTNIGTLFQKDDGSMFLSLNAFFNLAALPRNDGSDRVIIGLFNTKKREDSFNIQDNGFSSGNNDTGIPF